MYEFLQLLCFHVYDASMNEIYTSNKYFEIIVYLIFFKKKIKISGKLQFVPQKRSREKKRRVVRMSIKCLSEKGLVTRQSSLGR